MTGWQHAERARVLPGQALAPMRAWLLILGLMVYAMILIGGATRLTDSGLSITEWAPIQGAMPPLSQAAWLEEFDKYRETTEYKLQNRGMSMADFQYIYWWEWGHRQFGRLIGLVAVAGFAYFAIRRWLTPGWAARFGILIALGGLQGAIGWWMVASGIGETTRIDVAPYRLATHFCLALFIIAMIAWFWMHLGGRERPEATRSQAMIAAGLAGLIFLQMASGALVAGLDAGRSYNDWPLMSGELVPQFYIDPDLGARSLFEGREATQFNHRTLAYFIFAAAIAFAFWVRGTPIARPAALLAVLVTMQSLWGILTLVNAAPMNLALVHQGLGVVLLLASVRLAWRTMPAFRLSQSAPMGSAEVSMKTMRSPRGVGPATTITPPG